MLTLSIAVQLVFPPGFIGRSAATERLQARDVISERAAILLHGIILYLMSYLATFFDAQCTLTWQ